MLFAASVVIDLLGPIDTADASLIDNRHAIGEKVVEDAERLRRELRDPATALTLHTEQEGVVLHLIVIVIHLLVVGQHTTNTALARVGGDTIINTVVHGEAMRLLLGEAALQVHVPIDHREVLLLQADDGIVLLVDGGQRVVRIRGISGQRCDV